MPLTAAWLRKLDEPNLDRRKGGETYRLNSPADSESFVIRIEVRDGSADLVAKTELPRRDDGDRDITVHKRSLRRSDVEELAALIEEAGFWNAPMHLFPADGSFVLHGDHCTLEGTKHGRYHVVDRDTLTTTREFSQLCARFFFLADIPHPYSSYFMEAKRPPPPAPLSPAEQEELDRLNRGAYRP